MVPDAGRYIWDWYLELTARLRRVRDGACEPIPPSEFMAWKAATGEIVYPSEYAILCAMDVAYCDEMGKELVAYRAREQERIALEAKQNAPAKRRGK